MSDKEFSKFDRDFFKKEYCKSDEQINTAEKKLGHSLEEYYCHYVYYHYDKLDEINRNLLSTTFKELGASSFVNSIKSRVKDPYHLIDKLVRKILKDTSYNNIDLDNYHLYFDDLLGFRLILLYEEDWFDLHNLLLKFFSLNESKFTSKQERININQESEPFIIAKPEINIRAGDDDLIYKSKIPKSECFDNIFSLKSGRYYRSIHYSVYYRGYCFEIQVRSVFDEAWSEVDHNILYPNYLDIKEFVDFSKMLNRISGLSNEMSTYFRKLIGNKEIDNPPVGVPTLRTVPDELCGVYREYEINNNSCVSTSINRSASDIINDIVEGNGDII